MLGLNNYLKSIECNSQGRAVYGTWVLLVGAEAADRCSPVFRPASPVSSALFGCTMVTLRCQQVVHAWVGGKYAAPRGPLGQHDGCGGPGRQDL